MTAKLLDGLAFAVVLLGMVMAGAILRGKSSPQHLSPKAFRELAVGGHRMGPEDAPAVLVVFSDYGCTFCKVLDETLSELQDRYPDRLAIIVRHYSKVDTPGNQFALGAECAEDQASFRRFHRAAFANARALNYWNGALLVADSAGIPDRTAFEQCVTSRLHLSRLEEGWRVWVL